MQKDRQARIMLIITMVLFGTIGVFRKYIPLPSGLIAMARGLIGMLFLVLIVALRKQKLDGSAIRANLKFLIPSAIAMGFNWILLFEAYRYTSVATATLCYYMAPIFVILASPMLFKERLTRRKLCCVAVALIGMVLVSGIVEGGEGGTREWLGVLLGLGAAVLYASVVSMNKMIRHIDAYDKTIVQLGTAALVLLPYTLLTENLGSVAYTPLAIVMLMVVGILHTGVAYALYFGSMEHLKAQTIALFSYIDPVVAILLSATVLQEHVSVWSLIGAVLVLGSTLMSELPERK